MKSCVITRGERFSLTSYGGGIAYSLEDHLEGQAVLLQGDDADAMREALARIERAYPQDTADHTLGRLWFDHELCLAGEPVREAA